FQTYGYEVFQAMDVPGIDFLVKKGQNEATIQVKRARQHGDSKHSFIIGGYKSSKQNFALSQRAKWLIAVTTDLRMFLIPATLRRKIKAGATYVSFSDNKLQEFSPRLLPRLFTEV